MIFSGLVKIKAKIFESLLSNDSTKKCAYKTLDIKTSICWRGYTRLGTKLSMTGIAGEDLSRNFTARVDRVFLFEIMLDAFPTMQE